MPADIGVHPGHQSTSSGYRLRTSTREVGVCPSTVTVLFLPEILRRGLRMVEHTWCHGNSSGVLEEAVVDNK